MSLDQAARALKEQVEQIDFSGLRARLDERTEAMTARRAALEQDWSDFTKAFSTLIERVDDEAFALGEAGWQAVTAATDLTEPLGEGSQMVEETVAEVLGAVDGLTGVGRELGQRLAPALLEETLEPATALVFDTEELGDAVIASIDLVASVVGPEFLAVAEDSREMAKLNGDMATRVSEGVSAALAGDFEDWARRMRHAVEHVDAQGYRPASTHADAAVDAALLQCRAEQGAVFQSMARSLDAVLEQVAELLDRIGTVDLVMFDRTTRITDGAERLDNALAQGRAALSAARQFLGERGFAPNAA